MNDSPRARGASPGFLAIGLAAALGLAASSAAAEPQLRGIWMHANFIRTPAEADACIDKLERAGFNAAYLLVWYWGGQAAFQNPRCPMLEGVEPGYDPLGYLVKECRRRRIEVHAWFVNGAYGYPEPLHLLDRHPDWLVDSGGQSDRLWYDLGKPEVREFQSDLMIETLTRYDLDGVHFDYIRYDGSAICYCEHCQTEFASRYECEPFERIERPSFPLAAAIAGNPVTGPTTADVLAQFSDGTPAVATNELGRGKVLLLNWHAVRPPLPAVIETLNRVLGRWNATRDKVFVMDTEPNRQRYGDKGTTEAARALRELGYRAAVTPEERLAELPAGSLVVLSDVYLIPDAFAQTLEQFVRNGGLLLVIDGPILSIRNPSVQRVLGMSRPAKYLNRLEMIAPTGTSDFLVCEDIKIDLAQLQRRTAKWAEYRKSGVTELVRDVYRRAKQVKPDAQVTAAVFAGLGSAENVYQDWPGWIREGIVDYVIPMAYTTKDDVLAKQLAEWISVDPQLERIVPGLGIFVKDVEGSAYAPRDVVAIFTQYQMCMAQGARGTCFYSLDGTAADPVLLLGEPLIEALRVGPFRDKVPAYRPGASAPSP
jgi:uncharacterized lipoprotein YddW (UPF0748 family)